MSVLASKRESSNFAVFDNYYLLRDQVTDLMLRNFGYSSAKADKKIARTFGNKSYDEMSDQEKENYIKTLERNEAFEKWFIVNEREAIINCLRKLGQYIHEANSIQPQYMEELMERRLLQDKAIGCCKTLLQELQYSIETLPVDINKYTPLADMIDKETGLIKGWRKADNKYKNKLNK